MVRDRNVPSTMLAMVLEQPLNGLVAKQVPVPKPAVKQVLVRVQTCGICRTDLHIVDGELTKPKLPLILGHQIVGTVVALGAEVSTIKLDDHVGVPWLGWTCGHCAFCLSERENLCDQGRFTGYELDGGYAQYTVADERFCFAIPSGFPDLQAAPLLCAGLIGYRSLTLTGDARRLGFYGFGAAAHILIQVAHYQRREIYAFTRPGDVAGQSYALKLGAVWAGDSTHLCPSPLDAAIIFAPLGELVPLALQSVIKGGTVVCAGIHMSDIPSFPYSLLWGERVIRSVANLTRRDGQEFLALAFQIPVKCEVTVFPLEEANEALSALRSGQIQEPGSW